MEGWVTSSRKANDYQEPPQPGRSKDRFSLEPSEEHGPDDILSVDI